MVKSKKYTYEEKYRHLRKVTYYANKGGNVHVITDGLENIPKENGYVMFPNHQGMYDVLTIIATHEQPISVVIKKELEKRRLLCRVFQAMGAIPIDRNDIRQSLKVIQQVSEEVKKGRNFIIFAEGTRSKEGNKVGEFKGGSFKSAFKAKCPILPIALIDAFKPFDENSIKEVTVTVCYLKPIYYEEYKDMNTNELAAMVRQRICDKIKEMTKKERKA